MLGFLGEIPGPSASDIFFLFFLFKKIMTYMSRSIDDLGYVLPMVYLFVRLYDAL